MSKKILFIHHGSIAGGAPLSMLYTMQGMREAGFEPMAALAKPSLELHALYNSNGFATIETPWIPVWITWSGSEGKRWNPFMWKGIIKAYLKWVAAKRKLIFLLSDEVIDIVHLNSIALSNPASLLTEIGFPFVWHVREHGPHHRGRRYHFLREKLKQAKHVIFLSRAEQESWLGHNEHGVVVHNFIDFTQFDYRLSKSKARTQLGINPAGAVVLYVGGKKKHKGIIELLEGLALVRKEYGEEFVCLMPDSVVQGSPKNRTERKMLELIKRYGLERNCMLLPFDPNIVNMFAACDVLVFPATKPHFARPVIEASAMGKPVIASDLPAIDELVIPGKTGYLVPQGDINAIADRLCKLFNDEDLRDRMGEAGVRFAREQFEFSGQMNKIISVYQELPQT